MVRSAMMLASAFPELRDQALALSGRLTELARVMDDIRAEGEKLRLETARLSETRLRLAQLMENKRQSLSERQSELEQVRKEATQIARSVTDLNELISRLDQAVAAHIGQPSTGSEPQRLEVAALPDAAKSGVAAGSTPGNDADAAGNAARLSAIEIAPKGTQIASLSPGRIKPAVPFVQAKGMLVMPAQGRRVLSYGDKTQYGGHSKGLVLETRHGAQVTSPCDGWIVFAGEFRTFGQLLIINAGDGYHILLAGLSQIDVQLGQFVLTGEPVGLMSPAPKNQKSNSPGNAPVLYVEFRKDSRPVDPDPWWAAASQKVQG